MYRVIMVAWWFGTNSRFRAGMVVRLALNQVIVHHGHPDSPSKRYQKLEAKLSSDQR